MNIVSVILLKEVPSLGHAGEVKVVKRGFAQNYLLPRGLSVIATPQELAKAAQQKAHAGRIEQRARDKGKSALQKINGKTFSIKMKADLTGTLYAGCGTKEIVDLLAREGYEVPSSSLKINSPFKVLGKYPVAAEFEGAQSSFSLHIQQQR